MLQLLIQYQVVTLNTYLQVTWNRSYLEINVYIRIYLQ